MKRCFTLLIVLTLTALIALSGAAGAEQLTGTLSILANKDAWKTGYDEVCAHIAQQYGIYTDVNLVSESSFGDVLGVKLATGDAPDIFLANTPQVAEQFNATVNCLPLDDQIWVPRLIDPEFLRYKGDGHIYAMPPANPSSFFSGIYYNKQVMQDCGISDPKPATYEELLALCDQIKAAGYTPIYMTDADSWTTQVWTTAGWGVALDYCKDTIYEQLNTNQVNFQDVPELVDVLQKLQNLYTAGYVNENHLSSPYETSITALGENKAAMVISGKWFTVAATAAYPDIDLGSFAIPFLDGDANKVGAGAYVPGFWVTREGQSELALRFLELWSQPEQLEMVYEYQGVPSAYIDCEGGDVHPAVMEIVRDYVETGRYTPEFDSYFDSARPIMSTYLFGNIVECVAGNKTPVEALTDWNTKFEQYMAEMEVEGF